MLEWLFYAGHVTAATLRRSFERVYDLTERVIPPDIFSLPDVPEAEAHTQLVALSARALGLATAAELRDYFRLDASDAALAIARLIEEGILLPAEIPGWPPAYLHRDATLPRRVSAQALLAPFDPLVWARARTKRLFGFRCRIEIYTPAAQRQYGYYVLPFLYGEEMVGRVDLKADRSGSRLIVHAVHWEPGVAEGAREALGVLVGWLGLVAATHIVK